MINIPSFLVRTDSEKHIEFGLTHRARWMKGASPAKRFQTELEVRRKFRFGSDRLGRVEWNSKSRGSSGDDGEDDDKVGA